MYRPNSSARKFAIVWEAKVKARRNYGNLLTAAKKKVTRKVRRRK